MTVIAAIVIIDIHVIIGMNNIIIFNVERHASSWYEQAGVACMYLAHHELESVIIIIIIVISVANCTRCLYPWCEQGVLPPNSPGPSASATMRVPCHANNHMQVIPRAGTLSRLLV